MSEPLMADVAEYWRERCEATERELAKALRVIWKAAEVSSSVHSHLFTAETIGQNNDELRSDLTPYLPKFEDVAGCLAEHWVQPVSPFGRLRAISERWPE